MQFYVGPVQILALVSVGIAIFIVGMWTGRGNERKGIVQWLWKQPRDRKAAQMILDIERGEHVNPAPGTLPAVDTSWIRRTEAVQEREVAKLVHDCHEAIKRINYGGIHAAHYLDEFRDIMRRMTRLFESL